MPQPLGFSTVDLKGPKPVVTGRVQPKPALPSVGSMSLKPSEAVNGLYGGLQSAASVAEAGYRKANADINRGFGAMHDFLGLGGGPTFRGRADVDDTAASGAWDRARYGANDFTRLFSNHDRPGQAAWVAGQAQTEAGLGNRGTARALMGSDMLGRGATAALMAAPAAAAVPGVGAFLGRSVTPGMAGSAAGTLGLSAAQSVGMDVGVHAAGQGLAGMQQASMGGPASQPQPQPQPQPQTQPAPSAQPQPQGPSTAGLAAPPAGDWREMPYDQFARMPAAEQSKWIGSLPPADRPEAVQTMTTQAITQGLEAKGIDPADHQKAILTYLDKAGSDGWDASDYRGAFDRFLAEHNVDPQQAAQPGMLQQLWSGFSDMVQKNPMAMLALVLGVPMALYGFGSSLFGQGGFGSLLMGLLGAGGALYGAHQMGWLGGGEEPQPAAPPPPGMNQASFPGQEYTRLVPQGSRVGQGLTEDEIQGYTHLAPAAGGGSPPVQPAAPPQPKPSAAAAMAGIPVGGQSWASQFDANRNGSLEPSEAPELLYQWAAPWPLGGGVSDEQLRGLVGQIPAEQRPAMWQSISSNPAFKQMPAAKAQALRQMLGA